MQELRDNEQPWRSATLLFTRIRNRVPQLLYHLSFWKTASTVSFIVQRGFLEFSLEPQGADVGFSLKDSTVELYGSPSPLLRVEAFELQLLPTALEYRAMKAPWLIFIESELI